jgi:hypothetical protein
MNMNMNRCKVMGNRKCFGSRFLAFAGGHGLELFLHAIPGVGRIFT